MKHFTNQKSVVKEGLTGQNVLYNIPYIRKVKLGSHGSVNRPKLCCERFHKSEVKEGLIKVHYVCNGNCHKFSHKFSQFIHNLNPVA